MRAFLIHALKIHEYVKNGRTAVIFNPHETLLRKELDGTDHEATNQHVQASLDQTTSRADSDVDIYKEDELRRGKLQTS